MIGQEFIQGQLREMVELNTIPRFLILTGVKGSGKYTLAKWLTREMKAFLVEPELSVDAVREVVKNCYRCSGETVYVFRDADKMSAAAKNALLKVTEEPPRQAYFVLTVQNAENALETLRSRGTVIPMGPYTPAQRKEYLDFISQKSGKSIDSGAYERIVWAADNLGQVERYAAMDVNALYDFCNLVADNIGEVSGVNAFKIGQRIKLKEDGEGYDADLFFQMLTHVLLERIMQNIGPDETQIYAKMLRVCCKCSQELTLTGVKKDATLDMWILAMRSVYDLEDS